MFQMFVTPDTYNYVSLEVAFEIQSMYLSRHASYYNPFLVDIDRKPAFATAGEKLMIARLAAAPFLLV